MRRREQAPRQMALFVPSSDATITFLVLGVAVVLFVSNRVPVGVVALGAALALYAAGGDLGRAGLLRLRRPDGDLHRLAVHAQRGARRDRGDDVGGPATDRRRAA